MKFFKQSTKGQLDSSRLPQHIAIIMDGNGRWAKKRGLPRIAGHKVGAENFRKIATYCKDIGIKYLTIFAFSTENWKRPAEEVEAIMALLDQYLDESLSKMERDRVKMEFFGDISVLSQKSQERIERARELSKTFDGVQINICLNYGGRDDILRAATQFAQDFAKNPNRTLTEEMFSDYLYSKNVPDPDLVIRPSGEYRLSNFLLWQTAYSEFYFTDTFWPDFNTKELDKAILAYMERDRRFGAISTGGGKK